MTESRFAHRYAAWIDRRRWLIVAATIVFAAGAAAVASKLDVRADFSYLLPQNVRSVKDLRALEQRARVLGTAMLVVDSTDHVARARAAELLRTRVTALAAVSSVTFDRRVEHQYAWDHRWLFADLADLVAARKALEDDITKAKLAADPLYVSFDNPPPPSTSGGAAQPPQSAADRLRGKLHDAEKEKDASGELLGQADDTHHAGDVQLMIVHTAFSSGDVDRDRALVDALDNLAAGVRGEVPGVDVGVAGDVAINLAEHDAILNGMLRATLVTVVLVLAALLWFFRSPLAIGALSWSLVVGTLATFAFTRFALGYLNVATAFLSSIVIGNGINVGILVTARFLEELRAGHTRTDAIAGALAHTAAGTLTAALTASVAYASLVITVFRGFRHFGIIGGVGILLCWISAYIVLPAALAVAHQLGMRPRKEAPLGRWLAALSPRRPRVVAIVMISITLVGGVITACFLLGDPFESNFRNLRSQSAQIAENQRWVTTIDHAFGQGLDAGFVIGVDHRDEVAPLVEKLRALDRGKPDADALFSHLTSIDDLLPSDQPAKLAVLAQIRALLSSKDIDALDDDERKTALELRPPDDLRVLVDTDVPTELAWPFIEADTTRGKLILATPGKHYEVWDAHDTVRFATNVHALDLPADVRLGGASFVFADVLVAVLSDGPRATLASALGAVLVVLLVIGRNRYAAVTIACGISGTILMLAIAALLGFKINFLDFVALPITIGIGIEYSVNIVSRARQEGPGRTAAVLASTGGAVFLCSYTTIVGYGSLLLSQNLGIRSFGLAAMLGELTCLIAALFLAPALLGAVRRRDKT